MIQILMIPNMKILHEELSYTITGMCFRVQNSLGRHCREVQYADELEKLLKASKLRYRREVELRSLVPESPKGNRADFVIEDQIILDAKAKSFITKEDYHQMQRYLRAANLELGLVVNFRSQYLKPKRIFDTASNIRYLDHSDVTAPPVHSDRLGFTMIEVLVGLGVFMTISVIVLQVFVVGQSLARRQTAEQQIQNDLRAALESVTLDIRGGQVDYSKYPNTGVPSGAVSSLFLVDEDNTSIELRSSTPCVGCSEPDLSSSCESSPCLVKIVIDPSDTSATSRVSAVTGKSIKVIGGFPAFYIFPKTDPRLNAQPRTVVTMLLRAEPVSLPNFTDTHPMYLQTTATPRNQPLPQ